MHLNCNPYPPMAVDVFGGPDQGKTYLLMCMLQSHENSFVFDPLDEYTNLGTSSTDAAFLIEALNWVLEQDWITAIAMDEIYRFPKEFMKYASELFLTYKHYNKSWFIAAQHPHLVPPNFRGLTEQHFLFHIDEGDDIAMLEGVQKGLGKQVVSLDQYQFIYRHGRTQKMFDNVVVEIR